MRNNIILILISLLCITKATGQNIYTIEGGINNSKVTGYKSNLFSSYHGFQFGVYIDHIYANPIGFSSGIGLTNKGFIKNTKAISTNKVILVEDNAKLSTVYIPFLTTIHTKRFSFFVGPNVEILINQDETFKETTISNNINIENKTQHNYNTYKNIEIGLTIGADIKLFRGISISSKYVQSLNAIGRNYNWQRLGTLQFSLKKSFGANFTPKKLEQRNIENETNKTYNVTYSKNLTGIEFRKTGEGNRVTFHIKAIQKRTFNIHNISLAESSGQQRITNIEHAVVNVTFPFSIKINYTATNAVTGQVIECAANIEILEEGVWDVYLDN